MPGRSATWSFPILFGLVAAMASIAAAEEIRWKGSAWRVEAEEVHQEEYLGRDALRVRNGTAWLEGVSLQDGSVELDMAVPAEQGFHGLAFRARDDESFEHVYLRPHLSGKPDAAQYTPVFHGVSGWQLYTGPWFALPVEIAPDRWVHVRVRFAGARAEVSVDGQRLVFPRLLRPVEAGGIGLTASGASARFANVVVKRGKAGSIADPTASAQEETETPSGIVRRWRVSTPFSEDRLDPVGRIDPDEWGELTWHELDSGPRGIANLAMLRRRTAERNTVFAAVTLRSPDTRPIRARFGFSDRVTVYLNGQPLFRGNDRWRTRDYRFLGTVGLFDEQVLPLRPGDNELWLAVSEDFGGWGVTLQLPDPGPVEIRVPGT